MLFILTTGWTDRMQDYKVFLWSVYFSVTSQVLLAIVVLSWSYVIYASRIAAHWLMEKRTGVLRQDWIWSGPTVQVGVLGLPVRGMTCKHTYRPSFAELQDLESPQKQ